MNPSAFEFPTLLEGERIRLLPLQLSYAEELFRVGHDPAIWTYLPKRMERIEDMVDLIKSALQARDTGFEYPFVVYDKVLQAYVGSTRLLNVSIANRHFEIGWTWYFPQVWRTRVNTECKYLLLKYGFEEFRAVRIQLKADERNERSNQAIARLGATKEGVLRQDRILPDGFIRNANMYSIISPEWPDVKQRLEGFLKGNKSSV